MRRGGKVAGAVITLLETSQNSQNYTLKRGIVLNQTLVRKGTRCRTHITQKQILPEKITCWGRGGEGRDTTKQQEKKKVLAMNSSKLATE